MRYVDGQYILDGPEDAMAILDMVGGRVNNPNPTLGLDSPLFAAATSFLPGAGAPDFSVTGPGMSPDMPARTPMQMANSKASAAGKGVLSNLNDFRKGYEAGAKPLVQNQTNALLNLLPKGPSRAGGDLGLKISRFAGGALKNPLLQKGLAYAPVVGTALSVGDVVFGNESLANKAMDATAMTIGGAIGSVVPVVGTGLGIAAGKMASDATQWLFGDKKTPEQRKMELALQQLQGGGMV